MKQYYTSSNSEKEAEQTTQSSGGNKNESSEARENKKLKSTTSSPVPKPHKSHHHKKKDHADKDRHNKHKHKHKSKEKDKIKNYNKESHYKDGEMKNGKKRDHSDHVDDVNKAKKRLRLDSVSSEDDVLANKRKTIENGTPDVEEKPRDKMATTTSTESNKLCGKEKEDSTDSRQTTNSVEKPTGTNVQTKETNSANHDSNNTALEPKQEVEDKPGGITKTNKSGVFSSLGSKGKVATKVNSGNKKNSDIIGSIMAGMNSKPGLHK